MTKLVDLSKIRALLERIPEAIKQGDIQAILREYDLDDKRFSTFEDVPPYTRLTAAHFARFLEELSDLSDVNIKRYGQRIDLFGDFAVATGYDRWSFALKRQQMEGTSRFTIVLHRKEGRWKVVHEHFTKIPD